MYKDYVNFIFKDIVGLELPYCDLVDRKIVPRMPWHDISSVVYGEAARDVARHFIQRWNACKQEKLKKVELYPLLMPKSYESVHVPPIFRKLSHSCSTQILRSARSWSCAINTVEESIHQAYIKLIANAKHYIYIENQFFISLINGREVRNQIAQALLGRIVKAHKSRETFRVYILMPLLPAFEGELGEPSGASLQTILHWTYSSISKGPNSLLYNLEKEVSDFWKYIRFYALRTHTDLCGRLVSELIYIHSKLIIVDDKFALIGSANINDRSQLGDRDSEVALFVEDKEFVQSKMNGNDYLAGKFCSSLRRQLFAEHLGFLDEKISSADKIEKEQIRDLLQDPICDKFYQYFTDTAKKNTEIYDEIFKCFPSDQVRTWSDLAAYKSDASTNCPAVSNRLLAEHKIEQLSGTLVEFPTKFLWDENLAPQMLSKEGLAPVTLFT
uniref:phospholipase D n=1 Tax=Romanomermis culicivorax TaxID=13658 RepID=A0A915JJJ0_ROMCU